MCIVQGDAEQVGLLRHGDPGAAEGGGGGLGQGRAGQVPLHQALRLYRGQDQPEHSLPGSNTACSFLYPTGDCLTLERFTLTYYPGIPWS